MRRRRVALDAMGGDHAPGVPVAAARRAATEHGVSVVLVGDPSRFDAAGAVGNGVAVVAAARAVTMADDAALAVRARPDASIRVAVRLLAAGGADAVVSAGPTGATLAAGLLDLGRLPGVRRPAVAAVVPTSGGGTVLLDAGATADVQPEVLVTYARMGAAYARVRGVRRPRVGLLNVGAERGKGNALARAAHGLLSALDGFVGNVEPAAVLAGAVDVVVTDGFAGNVFLKTAEALAPAADRAHAGPGAAVLLGVPGALLVAHGAAGTDELVAALRTAEQVAAAGLASGVAHVLQGESPEPAEALR